MSRPVLIYTLKDPRTNEIRYIGKTVNIVNRMNRHKRDALEEGSTSKHRNAWLRSLYSENLSPEVSIIYEATEADWQYWEQYFIKNFREMGANLTNMTSGGERGGLPGESSWNYGRKCTEHTKEKISEKAKQRWALGLYDFLKKPLAEKYGKEVADKHRQRMIKYNKAKIVSDETKSKISQVQSRSILLIDDAGEIVFKFANARVAAEALGCKRSNVNNRRRFGGKLLGKYLVIYEDEFAI